MLTAALLALLPLLPALTFAQNGGLPLDVVARMALEDLMGIEVSVTTVAGVPRAVFHSPAAITVLTRDDVDRSGDRALPGAMRLVPGMLVARTHSHVWRVGARGFTGGLANKNHVLVDGRSVWDPLFGGQFWDAQDVVFEDLERIEVIRGPGPALWGANAMNSVINIITRSARETPGWYAMAGGGTHARRMASLRYGGEAAEHAWYRVYAKYVDYDHFVDAQGRATGDDWAMLRAGFRADAMVGEGLDLMLQGDGYGSLKLGEVVPVPVAPGVVEQRVAERRVRGGHFLARLGRTDLGGDGWSLQAFYESKFRRQAAGLEVRRDTGDLDFRHFFGWGDGHELIWGLAYKITDDRTRPGPTARFDPDGRSLQTFSGFVQNTVPVVPGRWFVMLGTKFEHNDFTGFELQPGARVWHTRDERQMFWAAVSSPIRVPTRTAAHSFLTYAYAEPAEAGGPYVPVGVRGNDDLRAERMVAYELGHRYRPRASLMLETALYFHDYRRLIFISDPLLGGQYTDHGSGSSHGGELELSWRIRDAWRLGAGYGYAKVRVRGPILRVEEGSHPRHMAHLRSFYDLTAEVELNAVLQYVDEIPQADVPDYLRLDLGVTWRPRPRLEITAWGQNLLHPSHREASFREFERSFHVRAALRY